MAYVALNYFAMDLFFFSHMHVNRPWPVVSSLVSLPPWDGEMRIGQPRFHPLRAYMNHRPGQHLNRQSVALGRVWPVLTSSIPGLTAYFSELSLLICKVSVSGVHMVFSYSCCAWALYNSYFWGGVKWGISENKDKQVWACKRTEILSLWFPVSVKRETTKSLSPSNPGGSGRPKVLGEGLPLSQPGSFTTSGY